MTSQEKAQDSLKFLKLRGDRLVQNKDKINERWLAKAEYGFTSDCLTTWRKRLLENEEDLAKVSQRIQMIHELFPELK